MRFLPLTFAHRMQTDRPIHSHELRSGGAGASDASAAVDARAPHLTVTRIAS